jgi:hypothetical protein
MSAPYRLPTLTSRIRSELAVPHVSEKEDFYKGYRIPAKSAVIGNSWYVPTSAFPIASKQWYNIPSARAMLHNPEVYPEPFSFNPKRFLNQDGTLNKSVKDPRDLAFGFGRRSARFFLALPSATYPQTCAWMFYIFLDACNLVQR